MLRALRIASPRCYMLPWMFTRQTTGSVVCPSCGSLVGVNDDKCYTCGRRNPGLWGYAPLLRRLGNDFGFLHDRAVRLHRDCTPLTLLAHAERRRQHHGRRAVLHPVAGQLRDAAPSAPSGAIPVFVDGMWWTVLSAGWLHGSALHILFNMMWVRQLGPITADIYGGAAWSSSTPSSSACGFLVSSTAGLYLARAPAVPRRRGLHAGRVSADLRAAGCAVHYGRRGGSSLMAGSS